MAPLIKKSPKQIAFLQDMGRQFGFARNENCEQEFLEQVFGIWSSHWGAVGINTGLARSLETDIRWYSALLPAFPQKRHWTVCLAMYRAYFLAVNRSFLFTFVTHIIFEQLRRSKRSNLNLQMITGSDIAIDSTSDDQGAETEKEDD
ncbi:hypothetical protein CVT26_008774 [Gymnopilus dilepis]|uniref:Uncharacterized protein n=1 Tax=Gymnopilus dilepis TaxID=231916 RepID=A0A409WXB1_9AGAR|nr:hypothetical protein CVT26_008774 [Gymnopilus dilepis]